MGKQTAEKKTEVTDLTSGRNIMDAANGVYVGIRIRGKVQRALKNHATNNGVRMSDLIATAVMEKYDSIIG